MCFQTIKESKITNFFLGSGLKDKVLKIMAGQKQITKGPRSSGATMIMWVKELTTASSVPSTWLKCIEQRK